MEGDVEKRCLAAFENARKKFGFTDVTLVAAIKLPELVILSCSGRIGSLIGKNGVIVSELCRELGSKVRVVESTKDERKVISDIAGNARLLGINEIYTPQGKLLKAIINRSDREKLVAQKENMEQAILKLTGTKTEIEFG